MSKPTIKRPMSADEIEAAKCLAQPTYPVASWDKRFSRMLSASIVPLSMAEGWHPEISEKAVPQLWRLFYRYRRQIEHRDKARLLRLAEENKAPDFRTPSYRIAQEQKAEIERLKYAAAMADQPASTKP